MAEVPYGPHLNNWIVNKLLERTTFKSEGNLNELLLNASLSNASVKSMTIKFQNYPSTEGNFFSSIILENCVFGTFLSKQESHKNIITKRVNSNQCQGYCRDLSHF